MPIRRYPGGFGRRVDALRLSEGGQESGLLGDAATLSCARQPCAPPDSRAGGRRIRLRGAVSRRSAALTAREAPRRSRRLGRGPVFAFLRCARALCARGRPIAGRSPFLIQIGTSHRRRQHGQVDYARIAAGQDRALDLAAINHCYCRQHLGLKMANSQVGDYITAGK